MSTGEMVLMTVTVTKVLLPDGRLVARYDTHGSEDSYMDTMALLGFVNAMIAEKAMRASDDE